MPEITYQFYVGFYVGRQHERDPRDKSKQTERSGHSSSLTPNYLEWQATVIHPSRLAEILVISTPGASTITDYCSSTTRYSSPTS